MPNKRSCFLMTCNVIVIIVVSFHAEINKGKIKEENVFCLLSWRCEQVNIIGLMAICIFYSYQMQLYKNNLQMHSCMSG